MRRLPHVCDFAAFADFAAALLHVMIDVTVLAPRRGKDDEEFGLFPTRVCFFFDPKFPFKYFKFSRRVWGVGQLRTLRLLDFSPFYACRRRCRRRR
jgi:hypothetical protein